MFIKKLIDLATIDDFVGLPKVRKKIAKRLLGPKLNNGNGNDNGNTIT